MIAALALHEALFHEGSLTLIVAPSERQSKLAFARVARLFRAYGCGDVDALSARRLGLELNNGSQVEALPGSPATVQGFSADLVVLDEAGFASIELFNALSPSLAATNGDMVVAGRPNGRHGPLYELWAAGDGWAKWRVSAEESSLISPAFLEAERQRMSERDYNENYLALFEDSAGSYFGHEQVMSAVTPDVEALVIEGVPETGG